MEKYDFLFEFLGTIIGCALFVFISVRMIVAFRYWRSRLFYKLCLVPKEKIDLSKINQEYKLYYGRIRVTQHPFTQDKKDRSVSANIELKDEYGNVVRWYARKESYNYQMNYERDPKSRIYDEENIEKGWITMAIIYTPKPVSEEDMFEIANMECFSTGQVTFLSGPHCFCKASVFIYGLMWNTDIRDLLYIDYYYVNKGNGVRIKQTISDKLTRYSEERN
jgi:hypothetical protein